MSDGDAAAGQAEERRAMLLRALGAQLERAGRPAGDEDGADPGRLVAFVEGLAGDRVPPPRSAVSDALLDAIIASVTEALTETVVERPAGTVAESTAESTAGNAAGNGAAAPDTRPGAAEA
jgi:hypothetical protein